MTKFSTEKDVGDEDDDGDDDDGLAKDKDTHLLGWAIQSKEGIIIPRPIESLIVES